MQVSVPGMYQNPAPYREQILTYSTALALTGRSAACAPPTAMRPAAEPRIRLLIIVMLNLQVVLQGQGRTQLFPPEKVRARLLKTAQSFRVFGHTRINARDLSEPPKRNDRGPPDRLKNYACANYVIKILYQLSYLYPVRLCRCGNTGKLAKCCSKGNRK